MLLSLSAAREDPSNFTWFRFNGKRPLKVSSSSDRVLNVGAAFGIRAIERRKEFYLVFPDKISQKFKIDLRKKNALEIASTKVRFSKKLLEGIDMSASKAGRKAAVYDPSHPRWRPSKPPRASEEKTKGIDCKDYQWRVYKGTRPLTFKLNSKDPITLEQNDVIGMRFIKDATGGKIVTPEGMRRSIPDAKVYDKIVDVTKVLPKSRWLTKVIPADVVKAANRSATEKSLAEQRQIKQQVREAKLAREAKAAAKRKKEREAKRAEQERVASMIARKDEIEETARNIRQAEVNKSKVDVGDFVREQIIKDKLDDEVLDVLDMDDLEEIEIDLEDMKVAVKEFDKEFDVEEDPTDNILSGLDDILESARQEDEDEIASELDSAEEEDDEESGAEESEELDEESESDGEGESGGDDDLEEEDSEEDPEEDVDDSDVEEDESEDDEVPEEEDFSEFEEEEDDDELASIVSELDEIEDDESDEEEAEEDDFDDEDEEDDLEFNEDESESDLEVEDDDEDAEEDIDLAEESEGDEDLEDEDEDDSEDVDAETSEDEEVSEEGEDIIDHAEDDVDDDELSAAEDELSAMESDVDDGEDVDAEPEEEAKLPEEADVISFAEDGDNRQFLVFDVAEMKSNDKVLLLKLYDMTNEPDEYHTVRVQKDRIAKFMENVEVVERMNAKTFGNFAALIEDYSRSKEKLV